MRAFPIWSAFVTGCSSDNADTTEPDGSEIAASVAASPHVPAVAIVSFEGEGEAFVEYGLAGAFDHTTPFSSGSVHEVAVIGLEAGKTWDWRAVVVDAKGNRRESAPGTFPVPSAPVPIAMELDEALTTAGAFAG